MISALRNTRPRPVRTLVAVMKSLIGAAASCVEVDALGEDVAQRIGAARIEVVGREQPRHQVHGDEDRRVVERPAAEQHVERAALERAELRRIGDPAPEVLERGARALGAPPAACRGRARRRSSRRPRCRRCRRSRSQGSSSRRSSTPQVKAPCDPPPCSARSIFSGARPLARPPPSRRRPKRLQPCQGSPGLAAHCRHLRRSAAACQGREGAVSRRREWMLRQRPGTTAADSGHGSAPFGQSRQQAGRQGAHARAAAAGRRRSARPAGAALAVVLGGGAGPRDAFLRRLADAVADPAELRAAGGAGRGQLRRRLCDRAWRSTASGGSCSCPARARRSGAGSPGRRWRCRSRSY